MARLLPPESSALELVSREVGVSVATLERWRADALFNGGDRRGGGGQRWTAVSRLEAVIATAAMDEAARNAWCREHGLYPADLDSWKQDAVAGLGEPRAASATEAREDRRRVKELERELRRKDKALAETAALLVLSVPRQLGCPVSDRFGVWSLRVEKMTRLTRSDKFIVAARVTTSLLVA